MWGRGTQGKRQKGERAGPTGREREGGMDKTHQTGREIKARRGGDTWGETQTHSGTGMDTAAAKKQGETKGERERAISQEGDVMERRRIPEGGFQGERSESRGELQGSKASCATEGGGRGGTQERTKHHPPRQGVRKAEDGHRKGGRQRPLGREAYREKGAQGEGKYQAREGWGADDQTEREARREGDV